MAFTQAGSVITQVAGTTDTSWLPLAGMTGVTVVDSTPSAAQAGHIIVDIGTNRIQIDGTMSIDGDRETLVTSSPKNNTFANTPFRVNGVFNCGVQTNLQTASGPITRYTSGTPVICTNDGGGNFSFSVGPNATLNMNGGTLRLSGMFGFENGARCEWNRGTAFLSARGGGDFQFRINSTSAANDARLNFHDCVLDGDINTYSIFTTSGIGTAGFTLRRGAFLNFVNSQPDLTFGGFNNLENASPFDYSARTNTAGNVPIINFDDCSRRVTAQQDNGGTNGYAQTRRNINLSFVDTSGQTIDQVSYFGRDINNGNRQNVFGNNRIPDEIYNGVDAQTPIQETVLVEVFSVIENNDILRFDDRTNGDDTIPIGVIAYNNSIASVQPQMFVGNTPNVPLQLSTTLLPDFSITEPNRAAVDAYTIINNAFEGYDSLKSLRVANYAGESETIVARSGLTLDARGFDVVLDPNAVQVRAFDGSTITLRSSAFEGNITTSGTVTLENGATVSGSVTDANGTRVNLTFTGAQAGSDIVVLNPNVPSTGDGSNVIATLSNVSAEPQTFTHDGTGSINVSVYRTGFRDTHLPVIGLIAASQTVAIAQPVDKVFQP